MPIRTNYDHHALLCKKETIQGMLEYAMSDERKQDRQAYDRKQERLTTARRY